IFQSHDCSSRAIRYRCCQLTNKLLAGLGDVMLDDELCTNITTIMLERTKDSIPIIREQAIYALACLQNPEDENCPIIEAYLFHLENDSHAAVRRAVVGSIALLSKTLPAILDRTKDLTESVRCQTFSVLAEKVNIRALSISQRLDLVDTGLIDRSTTVKKICTRKLFQSWLQSCDGSFLELLYSLDVVTSFKQCEKLLLSLFEQYSAEELVKNFTFLSDDLLISKEELDCEKVVYWKTLCQYLDSLGVDGADSLEKVLPNSIVFCDYLKSYHLDNSIKSETRSAEDELECQFIVEQLIGMLKFMDLSDIAARNAVQTLLHDVLVSDKINNCWISTIVAELHVLKPDRKELMNYICDLVSEIHEPVVLILQSVNEDEKRAIDLKNDPKTLLKCLTIICETLMLKNVSVKELTIELLKESIILPSIPNECDEVRNLGLKCLGLCCLNSKETAVRHLNIFLEACHIEVEVDAVKVTALKAIFDILLVFGIDLFVNSSSSEEDGEANSCSEINETANNLESNLEESNQEKSGSSVMIALLCKQMDSEVCEVQTVAAEGLAKLLLAGRIVASKVLTRLILLWFNPLSEDNYYLRCCLGTFLPVFASDSALNQELVVDSFLPVVKTLCNAPASSPLSKVDTSKVCDLLIELTRPGTFCKENLNHDKILLQVCNEILSNPNSFSVRPLSRVLNYLDLNQDSITMLKDLHTLMSKILSVVKDKMSLKALVKFSQQVEKALSACEEKSRVNSIGPECETQNGDNNDLASECGTKSSDSNNAASKCGTETDNNTVTSECGTETDGNTVTSECGTETDGNTVTSECG
ncbi:condensin complex subunit 3, partial [Octopus bimaculoides]|uniref:condensin complex subunit 3 n=1 Tax=Octopus bimaculoides TaxID=37653 RepID=UPI00071C39BE